MQMTRQTEVKFRDLLTNKATKAYRVMRQARVKNWEGSPNSKQIPRGRQEIQSPTGRGSKLAGKKVTDRRKCKKCLKLMAT